MYVNPNGEKKLIGPFSYTRSVTYYIANPFPEFQCTTYMLENKQHFSTSFVHVVWLYYGVLSHSSNSHVNILTLDVH
jgi:hypothetical protein